MPCDSTTERLCGDTLRSMWIVEAEMVSMPPLCLSVSDEGASGGNCSETARELCRVRLYIAYVCSMFIAIIYAVLVVAGVDCFNVIFSIEER